MEFKAKTFAQLSTRELYEILKSRAEIFFLEQGIVCQDMDNVDYISLHCFFEEKGRVVAYLRAFLDEDEKDTVNIGRVLTLEHGKGTGSELMRKSIAEIAKNFSCRKIKLHAQKQAAGFYVRLGFEAVSDEFMEEGVVHISMEKILTSKS